MTIPIKNEKEIAILRDAGKILAEIVDSIIESITPGTSTAEIDNTARALCKSKKVAPGFLGYRGYPAVSCLGVNDTVVHGIPSLEEIIKEGDIISVDMGIIYKGYYSDMAKTVGIGEISEDAMKLIRVTEECLYAGIKAVKPGNTIGDIGNAIQTVAEKGQCSVVRQMVGHGIGKALHEDPQIPGYGKKGEGERLVEGMVIAIEAIINEGDPEIRFLDDDWTTKTMDGKLSALFEHSVLVAKDKGVILTKK